MPKQLSVVIFRQVFIAVSLGFVALAERAEALQAIDFASAWSEVQRINNGIAAEKANVERTELMVEATYPLDEGVATTMTVIASSVLGVALLGPAALPAGLTSG